MLGSPAGSGVDDVGLEVVAEPGLVVVDLDVVGAALELTELALGRGSLVVHPASTRTDTAT